MAHQIKGLLIIALLFSCVIAQSQTGIGTTTPVNKFEVVTSSADPVSSGSSANGNLRLGSSSSAHVLDFGLSSTSTFSWLQARSKSNYSTPYNLALNPNGGNVGIGTTTPTAKLNIVGGGIRIHHGFSNNSTSRPALNTSTIGNYEIRGVGGGGAATQADGGDDGFLRLSAGGGTSSSSQSSIDLSGYSDVADMLSNILLRTAGTERLRIDNTGTALFSGNVTGNNTSTSTISGFAANMNVQTGTSYTLLASDNGKIITLNNASPITLNIPSLFAGFNCMIVQLGAGQVTLNPSSTTIANRSNFTKTGGTNAIVTILAISSNSYISSGDMSN